MIKYIGKTEDDWYCFEIRNKALYSTVANWVSGNIDYYDQVTLYDLPVSETHPLPKEHPMNWTIILKNLSDVIRFEQKFPINGLSMAVISENA